jgi:RNA polymerase sigma-70 factor, ECF subfamily
LSYVKIAAKLTPALPLAPALTPLVGPEGADDASLARALIERHREAPEVAWHRFRPAVQTTLRRLLGAGEDIHDLTQDVFARFFEKVQGLRSLDALRPFVIGIAVRRAREEIRRRHVRRTLRPAVEDHLRPDESAGTAWDPARRHAAMKMVRVMEELGRDGEIYALRAVAGCELQEIAQITGLSLSTVRRRLVRASRLLERRFVEEGFAGTA